MNKLLHAFMIALVTCETCWATPGSSDTLSVSGKVVSVVWIDQVKFESDGVDGLMTSGTIKPRHYVILESESGTAAQRDQLSSMLSFGLAKWPHWSVAKAQLIDNQVMIEIPGHRIPTLVKGASVKIKNYRVTGDEWLTGAEFDELEVAGQRIETKAQKSDAGLPAALPESKSKGIEKSKPESQPQPR